MLGCGKFLSVGGVRSRCPCSGVWHLANITRGRFSYRHHDDQTKPAGYKSATALQGVNEDRHNVPCWHVHQPRAVGCGRKMDRGRASQHKQRNDHSYSSSSSSSSVNKETLGAAQNDAMTACVTGSRAQRTCTCSKDLNPALLAC